MLHVLFLLFYHLVVFKGFVGVFPSNFINVSDFRLIKRGDDMDGIEMRPANPSDAVGIAELYGRVYEGKYPLIEYMDSNFIKGAVESSDYVWYLAKAEGVVVGSTVGSISRWNNSCELGKTVVERTSRGRGIARGLCELVREAALSSGVDVLWGSLRNLAMYEISKCDGLSMVGTSGAHRVTDRELHLIGLRLSENAKEKRVAAIAPELYSIPGVQCILEAMSLVGRPSGDYPAVAIVTQGISANALSQGFYHPQDRCFVQTGGRIIVPEYHEVTVLADKVPIVMDAVSQGFEIVAFLPGWYEEAGHRYDCVRLAKFYVQAKVQDLRLEQIADQILRGFRLENSPSMPIPYTDVRNAR